ncbi:hypothetical protein A2U01_0066086, partial [Trifolium medium]|nr:hypothetical protein [Trifolium medium]
MKNGRKGTTAAAVAVAVAAARVMKKMERT